MVNDETIALTECENESTLISWWFSEFDPACYNVDLSDCILDNKGDCLPSLIVINATWVPLVNVDDPNNLFPEVKLRFIVENDTIAIDMESEGEP